MLSIWGRLGGHGGAPRLRRVQGGAELLLARGVRDEGALRDVAVRGLADPQLRLLVPDSGRQEVEASVAAQLHDLQREPGLRPTRALEEVAGGQALDRRHGVRLAAARLAEHEHRAGRTLAGAPHELGRRDPVDLGVLRLLPEGVVELEDMVLDVAII